jgi:hypothetical protein
LSEAILSILTKIQIIVLKEAFQHYYITLVAPVSLNFILGIMMFRNLNQRECLALISFVKYLIISKFQELPHIPLFLGSGVYFSHSKIG